MYFQFAYMGSLDRTVLNNATKHASVVTMSMVCVFLGANKAGRGTCVVKVFFFMKCVSILIKNIHLNAPHHLHSFLIPLFGFFLGFFPHKYIAIKLKTNICVDNVRIPTCIILLSYAWIISKFLLVAYCTK